jgi:hypothetical protein
MKDRAIEQGLDAGDLASGVYWYSLVSGPFSKTRKLVLVK